MVTPLGLRARLQNGILCLLWMMQVWLAPCGSLTSQHLQDHMGWWGMQRDGGSGLHQTHRRVASWEVVHKRFGVSGENCRSVIKFSCPAVGGRKVAVHGKLSWQVAMVVHYAYKYINMELTHEVALEAQGGAVIKFDHVVGGWRGEAVHRSQERNPQSHTPIVS